jgi:pilus assembly protein FimV
VSELSKTIALIGLLAPFGAGALGIGDIRSNSSLNQPLSAEIPLVLSGGDKLSNIQVRLASPEAFEKASVERLHALTQLQFKPVAKPNGSHTIQVSSRNVIQDTFLDFLVEVESPQGTVLREFTLLLDPSRAVSQASSPIRPSSTYDLPYQPDQNWGGSRYDESEGYDRADRAPKTHYPTPDSSNATPPIQFTGETYGPVRRREKLTDIASRIQRPAAVTREQMATGLFLANPRAFKRTMNSLRAGSILRIPTEEYLSQINPGEANQTLAKRSGQSRSGWESEQPIDAPARTGGGAVAEVSSRIPSALKKENEELREQLLQLEQRLEEAQRMLALKNAELATLHSHEASIPARMAEASNPAEAVLQANPPAIESTQKTQTGSLPVDVIATEPETPVQPAPSVPETKRVPVQPPKPVPAAPAPATNAETTYSMESLMAPVFWQASGALTALGLAAWLYRRRRNSTEPSDNPADSVAASKPDETTLTSAVPSLSSATANREISSTPPESPITTDVLDPLWETDVYLRYGRFTQAEALMRETIKNEPGRDDLKQKLFEVLHLANKSEALTEYFQELKSDKPDFDDAFWLPMQAMRPELFPITAPSMSDSLEHVMLSEIQPAADAIIAGEIELHPVSSKLEPSLQALDLDNTDFTAELRALEEASTRLSPQTDIGGPIALESDLGADLENADGIDDVDEIPDTGLSTTSSEIDDLVSELIASAKPDSAVPEQHETALLDPDDSGFEEELQTLETHYRDVEPEAKSTAKLTLTQTINGADEADQAAATQDLDNLLTFDTSELNLESNQINEPASSSELELENLIPFDTSDLDATLAAVSFKPSRNESAPFSLTPPSDNIEMDELLTGTQQPLRAAGKESFGSLDFELELIDPVASTTGETGGPKVSGSLDSQVGTETDDFEKRLVEARQLAERNEKSAARSILQEIQQRGSADQKAAADELLNEITKVRLSLVTPVSRKVS